VKETMLPVPPSEVTLIVPPDKPVAGGATASLGGFCAFHMFEVPVTSWASDELSGRPSISGHQLLITAVVSATS
jgi:hypothetical protein